MVKVESSVTCLHLNKQKSRVEPLVSSLTVAMLVFNSVMPKLMVLQLTTSWINQSAFLMWSQAMASKVSIMSTCTVKAAGESVIEDNCKIIELTPWHNLELQIEYHRDGVLYRMPTSQQVRDITNTSSLIHHLRVSLS